MSAYVTPFHCSACDTSTVGSRQQGRRLFVGGQSSINDDHQRRSRRRDLRRWWRRGRPWPVDGCCYTPAVNFVIILIIIIIIIIMRQIRSACVPALFCYRLRTTQMEVGFASAHAQRGHVVYVRSRKERRDWLCVDTSYARYLAPVQQWSFLTGPRLRSKQDDDSFYKLPANESAPGNSRKFFRVGYNVLNLSQYSAVISCVSPVCVKQI